MRLVTLKLAELGEGCLVDNGKGKMFLDLSKVRCAKIGYNDQWEMVFIVSKTKRITSTGKAQVAVMESQTQEERDAKTPPVYIGNGIVLFESDATESMPAPSAKKAAPAPKAPPASTPASDLPFN